MFVYDDDSPEGRPLKIGDPIEGGGNAGTLVDIQWQVYVANKKACWYQFDTTQGEHGYPDGYPRRNADVTDRDRLIIDPGPRIVNGTTKRRASFDRSGEGSYATTFPPRGADAVLDRYARRDDDRRQRPAARARRPWPLGQREVRPGRAAHLELRQQ